ncbi:hypothetical protein COY87_01355 [Candidatus Roizmanbacteria bacterium CG_4_10_14_0_8_um_filter_33_9]|uniref:Glycosyltransferase 2-like domain-containing protein n=1 Tax=Candidatus Roizmanbacteria bacterium CG_4_10_14_0_8_um_filter_33_9 TaxID=1974826 RepID=A0A2M7QK46_9BACT|nr:MAG: hypothetical protein COY87_01355 [Candidatus Roizmanbacteria bacterium CG_4_10_14_0_8_um_filter_33_9]
MISVVIPTYKNKEQFIKNLGHNLFFLKECEVIVVNDSPQESLMKDLMIFPQIQLIENKTNLGFAGAIHRGIQQAKGNFILLLNNDVLLNDNFFLKAANILQKDEKMFAVSFAQKEKNITLVGKNQIYWKSGFFQHKKADNFKLGINGWAEGGACIINKKLYEKVGGFDPLYSPFYWEDVDLSYRAWKNGYQILFDPSIVVIHHHKSTIGKFFNSNWITEIAYRNQFIFIWKNIEDPVLLLSHLIHLLYSLPIMMFKDFAYVKGFIKAVFLLPAIIAKRKHYAITDYEVLSKFSCYSGVYPVRKKSRNSV